MQLSQVNITSPEDNGRRMCSVLVLLYLLWKSLDENIEYDNCIIDMFMMLFMEPQKVEGSKWTITELKILKSFVPKEFYSKLAECLIKFLQVTIDKKKMNPALWLLVLPVIHIFQEKVQVTDTIEEFQFIELSKWYDDDIILPPSQFISVYLPDNSR